MDSESRKRLRTGVKYAWLLGGLAILYVLLDFSFDFRPSNLQTSYRFEVGELEPDQVRILRQDNLSILVMRRSAATIASLEQGGGLQDPGSSSSRQPDAAANLLRSRNPEYFVSYALGTDLGCALELEESGFREICGQARYDFAGRALDGARSFRNLSIPDYNFDDDFTTLTIFP